MKGYLIVDKKKPIYHYGEMYLILSTKRQAILERDYYNKYFNHNYKIKKVDIKIIN